MDRQTTTTYAPPYVVVEKKNFPSPKEDSVTDLGQTYQRVSIYLLNASRDRGQYDCYITAIEIGNNEEI